MYSGQIQIPPECAIVPVKVQTGQKSAGEAAVKSLSTLQAADPKKLLPEQQGGAFRKDQIKFNPGLKTLQTHLDNRGSLA